MATRVNTKFVLLLSIVVMGVGIILGGLWFLKEQGNTERLKAVGDQLVKEGDLRKASEKYGRAVRKKPGNREYIRLYEETLKKIRPRTRDEATTYYGKYLTGIRHVARHFPHEAEGHLRLLAELERYARWFGDSNRAFWESLEHAADDMWEKMPTGDPERNRALAYQGLARIQQDLSSQDNEEGEQKLKQAIEAFPDDDMAWATLVTHAIKKADQLRLDGQNRRAGEAYDAADEILRRAVKAVPDGPQTMKIQAMRLLMRQREGDSTITDDRLREAADSIMRVTKGSDTDWLVFGTANALKQLLRINGVNSAIELVQDFLDRHPENIFLRLELARELNQNRDFEQATRAALACIESKPMQVDLMTDRQSIIQRMAGALLVDIKFSFWQQAEDDQKDDAITQLVLAKEKLNKMVGDDNSSPAVIKADAKLAYARGQWTIAANHFEKLFEDGQNAYPVDIFRLSAECLDRLGETGGARSRIDEALQRYPNYLPLLQDRARLLVTLKRYDLAKSTIERALKIDPENQQSLKTAELIANAEALGSGGQSNDPVIQALVDATKKFRENDLDSARVILLASLSKFENDVRLLNALLRLEIAAGNKEEALKYVERALVIHPDDPQLMQFKNILEQDDAVAALLASVNDTTDDPAERAILMLANATRAAPQYEEMARQLTEQNKQEQAAEYTEYARRIRTLEQNAFEEATKLDPDNFLLIEYRFAKALKAQDWAEVDIVLARAKELNADSANGLMYEGRYAIERKDYARAVTALEAAVKIRGYSAIAWRGLGLAYRQVGRMTDSVAAYERAYQSNPNNPETLQEYVGLLFQLGQETTALALLQQAHEVMPNDTSIREQWLQMETRTGDKAMALVTRRQILKDEPDNLPNASGLIALLGSLEPERALLIDKSSTQPKFNERQWSQLSTKERNSILADARSNWESEAGEILDSLEKKLGDTLSLARTRAFHLRERGDVLGGLELLEQFINRHSEKELTSAMFIALADYQKSINRPVDAIATLEQGLHYQVDAVRDVDEALGNYYFPIPSNESRQKSIEHFQKVLEVRDDHDIRMRIVEALIRLEQFDEAERELAKAMGDKEYDLLATMLSASIADNRGRSFLTNEQAPEASVQFAKSDELLARAREMDPANQAPFLLEAQSLLVRFEHSGESELIDRVFSVLDQAEEIRKDNKQIPKIRANAYRAKGDLRAAAGELRKAVELAPNDIVARRELIAMLETDGAFAEAIKLLREGIGYDNTIVLWHQRLGILLRQTRNDLAGATEEFRRAFELAESEENLALWVDSLLLDDDPDYASISAILKDHEALLEAAPRMKTLKVRVLEGDGKHDDALTLMREIYGIIMKDHTDWSDTANQNIDAWFETLAMVFPRQDVADVESFVEQLAGESPDTRIFRWLAHFWSRLGTRGMSRAIELQTRAIETCPPAQKEYKGQLYIDQGGFFFNLNQYEQAITVYEQALALNPENAQALNNIAFVAAEKMNDANRALPYAQQAAALQPNDSSVLDTLGWVHYKLEQYDDAVKYLIQSMGIRDLAETQMHLAYAYYGQKEFDRARRHIRSARALPSMNENIREKLDRLETDIRAGG